MHDGLVDEWVDRWVGGWMDGWMDRWVDGCRAILTHGPGGHLPGRPWTLGGPCQS